MTRRPRRAPGRRPAPAGDDRGQATVELVVLLPAVVLVCLVVVQVGALVQRRLLVTHAAREVARAAAVAGGEVEPGRATGLRGGLDPDHLTVTTDVDGEHVEVTVRYRDPTDVALVGALVPDVTFEARAAMRVEHQPGR